MIFFSSGLRAQDERVFKKLIFSSTDSPKNQLSSQSQMMLESRPYFFDLDKDGLEESFVVSKIDGQDWLSIRDRNQRTLTDLKLNAQGAESRLDKLRIIELSDKFLGILVYFYEGKTQAKRLEASARIYVIAAKKDLTEFVATEGPHIFHEKSSQRDQYLNRDFRVEAIDLDKDDTKEVIIHYHNIQRVLKFKDGQWVRI